jgi:hypothetical protein
VDHNAPTYVEEQPDIMDGRCIVGLKIVGQQLWCVSCKETLSLQYIENETCRGLCSQFLVPHKCLLLNEVATGKQHYSCDKRSVLCDVNYKAVLGKF